MAYSKAPLLFALVLAFALVVYAAHETPQNTQGEKEAKYDGYHGGGHHGGHWPPADAEVNSKLYGGGYGGYGGGRGGYGHGGGGYGHGGGGYGHGGGGYGHGGGWGGGPPKVKKDERAN